MYNIVTVVGARPQFVKAATISRIIKKHYSDVISEKIIHTGQHYDDNMSADFFTELSIPKPYKNLNIVGGLHGRSTGMMLEAIEQLLLEEKPDMVLVYGDTNSTLAGSLSAAKLCIPIAHIEAGLRSFNTRMPEEINRKMTDHVSSILFCPTDAAVQNLIFEGIEENVHNVGDVMYDAALFYMDQESEHNELFRRLNIVKHQYVLATCHRAENTDDSDKLVSILEAFSDIAKKMPVVLPLHPRTRKMIISNGFENLLAALCVVEPMPYISMLNLERYSFAIITDSGGMQKEAFFFKRPCITIRKETEWVETVESGSNQLVGSDKVRILEAFNSISSARCPKESREIYGDGNAAKKIVENILSWLSSVKLSDL